MVDFGAFRTWLLTTEKREPTTAGEYVRRLVMVGKEGVDLERVTVDAALAYLADVRASEDFTISRFNNRSKALNAWLRFRDRRKDNPLPVLPEEEEEFRALEDEGFATLKAGVLALPPGARKAALALALGVGIRPTEARRADLETVTVERDAGGAVTGGTLAVGKPAKRGKKRTMPIPAWVAEVVAEYLAVRETPTAGRDARALLTVRARNSARGVGRVHVVTLGRWLQEFGAELGVYVNWQVARHTVATRLLEEGVDIRYVQFVLGHKSIKSTMRYAEARGPVVAERLRSLPSFQRQASTGLTLSGNKTLSEKGDDNSGTVQL